jgi:hypothetical protein
LNSAKRPRGDVQRALKLAALGVEDDVGEDAALRRLLHVLGIPRVEERDHRTGRLVHDPGDHRERVLAVQADPHQRDVREKLPGEGPDLLNFERACDHRVPEGLDEPGDRVQPFVPLVGDEHL